MDGLPSEAKVRYKEKLTLVGMNDCPYRLPADVWVDDPTQWPDLEYPDLYHYLIDSPGKKLFVTDIKLRM